MVGDDAGGQREGASNESSLQSTWHKFRGKRLANQEAMPVRMKVAQIKGILVLLRVRLPIFV